MYTTELYYNTEDWELNFNIKIKQFVDIRFLILIYKTIHLYTHLEKHKSDGSKVI